MTVRLEDVSPDDKGVLRELLNLYLYDLCDLIDRDPNEHGRFEYRWLDHYWTEPDRHAFFIRASGRMSGFVLVNAHTTSGAARCIAEFFVTKSQRRRGVGRAAAHEAFRALPGTWEVCTDAENGGAAPFWRATIAAFTDGAFEEERLGEWTGPCFTFTSP